MRTLAILEAVINISEGRDRTVLARIGAAAGATLLDAHADPHHHRSVFTLGGAPDDVEAAARSLATEAAALVDMRSHVGVHPRLGAIDVVPFVAYGLEPSVALGARNRFGEWFGRNKVPCFFYGPERSLPEIRRTAWSELRPDTGPDRPHPLLGACCVGVRPVLVAYNIVVEAPLAVARVIAAELRGPGIRALGLPLGDEVQVSFNLTDPHAIGPEVAYDLVAARAPIKRAELVGLIPKAVMEKVPLSRRALLDLEPDRTIEARAGL